MRDLLLALAIDFNAPDGFAGRAQQVHRSLEPGKGGQVQSCQYDGALLAVRAEGSPAGPQARSTGWQPARGPDGRITLLAGRLQEREEARRRFGLPTGARDAEIYAAAFARLGPRCDTELIGDYAVAQWDPAMRSVRLSRSPMSMQPLHVWRDGSRLVAASLPRTLVAAGLEPQIDPIKLEDSLLLNFSDARRSWYRCAHRIAAGTAETHDRGGYEGRRFFSLGDVEPVWFVRDEDYVEALDEQFRRATRAELDGVERPGLMLSGGLDSQCVASYLAGPDGAAGRIHSFTSVPQQGWAEPDKPYSFGDEAPHVRALAAQIPQIEPHFLTGEERVFGQDLDAIMQLGGWPMRNESNLHWVHAAYEQAAALGCDAMFSGAAGNATFSYDGQTGYASWLRDGNLGRLYLEFAARRGDDRSLLRRFVSLALLPNLPRAVQRNLLGLMGRGEDPFTSWCPMRADHAARSGALERATDNGADPYFHPVANALQWRSWALDELLCEGAEIELAFRLQYGIPARDPTLFQPLVEFTAGIPDDQYLRDGEDRWLARRLLKGRIPETVRTERRMGRQSPDWALRFQRDRAALTEELRGLRNDSQLRAILDLDRLIHEMESWDGEEDTEGIWKGRIHAGVARALSTARFVRYVERRNVGS